MYNFGRIKEKLAAGQTLLGTHVFCGAPALTEAMSLVGFDMIWIDMEHTAIGIESLQNNLIAARAGGTPAFVRIPWNDKVLAKPVIDMGPEGIIFPYVRTADDARAAVASCEYPPAGERGYGPLRALDYGGIAQTDYVDRIYREMWRIIQIEHIEAVEALDEILEVEGIDAYVVGPNDLSASMGHIGRTGHPDMIPVYDEIGRKMREHGKLFGVSTGFSPDVIGTWLDRGARMIFAGNDVGYVYDGAKTVLQGLKELAAEA